jgi:hypothetical protein
MYHGDKVPNNERIFLVNNFFLVRILNILRYITFNLIANPPLNDTKLNLSQVLI